MRIAILGSVFLLWISSSASANETLDRINDACSREWGLDFAMIEHCRKRQVDAGIKIFAIRQSEADADPYRALLAICYSEWTDRIGSDWAMMLHCYNRQSDAYKRLNLD